MTLSSTFKQSWKIEATTKTGNETTSDRVTFE